MSGGEKGITSGGRRCTKREPGRGGLFKNGRVTEKTANRVKAEDEETRGREESFPMREGEAICV